MPDTESTRRSRGAVARDKEALDNIAALLNQPISCQMRELAAMEHDLLMRVGAFVAASGR